MTWKSYAVVSSATALAAWLAAQPPATPPGTAPVPATDLAAGTTGASNILEEDARLQARVREQVEYQRPERNPFRFNAAPRSALGTPRAAEPVIEAVPMPAALLPPPVSLSGIAENQVGERTERTAILSSPGGVLLVREGDQVLGQYRVGRVEANAVELIRVDDGTTTRLTLR
jgi:hypothetical protein